MSVSVRIPAQVRRLYGAQSWERVEADTVAAVIAAARKMQSIVHHPLCGYVGGYGECTCGASDLVDAIKALDSEGRKENG